MNIYKISQGECTGYDTYDSAVVVAESEEDAVLIHPSNYVTHIKEDKWMGTRPDGSVYEYAGEYEWPVPSQNAVKAEFVGTAAPGMERRVIVSSFNAG